MSERPGRRDQMERFERHLIQDGCTPKHAADKARELAVKADRRESNVNPQKAVNARRLDETRERAERAAYRKKYS